MFYGLDAMELTRNFKGFQPIVNWIINCWSKFKVNFTAQHSYRLNWLGPMLRSFDQVQNIKEQSLIWLLQSYYYCSLTCCWYTKTSSITWEFHHFNVRCLWLKWVCHHVDYFVVYEPCMGLVPSLCYLHMLFLFSFFRVSYFQKNKIKRIYLSETVVFTIY